MTKEAEIIKKLNFFQEEAREYKQAIAKDIMQCIEKNGCDADFSSKSWDCLNELVKTDILELVEKNQEILGKYFWEKVYYYENLANSKEYRELINQLYKNVNELYGLIATCSDKDINENKLLQEKYHSFLLNCRDAIESLNTKCEEVEDNYCYRHKQILDLIKDKANFYNLNFHIDCGQNTGKFQLDDENSDILDKFKIINQYIVQEKILNDIKHPALIENNAQFNSLKVEFKTNIDKLKTLLKGNIKEDNINYYYLFYRFRNCDSRYSPHFAEDCVGCFPCFDSVVAVLEDLKQYLINKDCTEISCNGFTLNTETGKAVIKNKKEKIYKTFNTNKKRFKLLFHMLKNKKMNIYELAELLGWKCRIDEDKPVVKVKLFDLKKNVLSDINHSFNLKVNGDDIFIDY